MSSSLTRPVKSFLNKQRALGFQSMKEIWPLLEQMPVEKVPEQYKGLWYQIKGFVYYNANSKTLYKDAIVIVPLPMHGTQCSHVSSARHNEGFFAGGSACLSPCTVGVFYRGKAYAYACAKHTPLKGSSMINCVHPPYGAATPTFMSTAALWSDLNEFLRGDDADDEDEATSTNMGDDFSNFMSDSFAMYEVEPTPTPSPKITRLSPKITKRKQPDPEPVNDDDDDEGMNLVLSDSDDEDNNDDPEPVTKKHKPIIEDTQPVTSTTEDTKREYKPSDQDVIELCEALDLSPSKTIARLREVLDMPGIGDPFEFLRGSSSGVSPMEIDA